MHTIQRTGPEKLPIRQPTSTSAAEQSYSTATERFWLNPARMRR